MPAFIRVTDEAGNQFDVPVGDSRIGGPFTASKAADAVIDGPHARPRPTKLRTDLAGTPAARSGKSSTAQEA